jgi:hypothetical protein
MIPAGAGPTVMAGAGPPSTPLVVHAKAWMPTIVGMTLKRRLA